MEFTIRVEIDPVERTLTIIPTETMREWTRRNELIVKEVHFDQYDGASRPPLHHIFI